MGQAIGDILPLAIGVALSPLSITAIALMLGTPRARSNGPAFAIGWAAGMAIVGTIVLIVADEIGAEEDGAPATWASVLKLALGALFLLLAARTWRTRPAPGQEPQTPKWMATVDTFTAGKSLAAGALLSGVGPKNLPLTIAAATVIAAAGIPAGEQAVALAVFVALASITILAPLVIYFTMGTRGREILDGLKSWMVHYNAVIMTVLLLVLGVALIGDSIAGLSA